MSIAKRKLSKRTAAAPVRDRRAAGARPEGILGEAAYRVGLIEESRPAEREELLERVAQSVVAKRPAR